jgi:hypothetical protein
MPVASSRRLARWALAAAAVLLTASALTVSALGASTPSPSTSTTSLRSLLSSKELWATVDVCDSPHHPNTVGVRGSMPGDGNTHDKMYMSFRLQYLNTVNSIWVDVPTSSAPTFVSVGAGATARQGGTSFQLVPVAGRAAVRMRGVVDFQWRRGKKVLQSTSRPTTPKHKSLAGADPKGYSAATCLIG